MSHDISFKGLLGDSICKKLLHFDKEHSNKQVEKKVGVQLSFGSVETRQLIDIFLIKH